MEADLLLLNGRVYTMDNDLPVASALAVHSGRIVAVGDDTQIRSLAGAQTEHFDLRSRMVLPAFSDAHIHLVHYGLALTQVQLDGLQTLQQAVAQVAERARTAEPAEWIRGWGWNRNLWPGAPFPTREDLDPVTPDNPVILRSKDGHAAWLNSLGLRAAGLTKDTADPPGAELVHDPETGELTGILKEEAAIRLVEEAAGPVTHDASEKAIHAATEHLHRLGIVSVHVPEEHHELRALQRVWLKGELSLRVNMMVPDRHIDNALALGLLGGFGDDFLRLASVKGYADGSLGARTADMFEPYEGEPDNRGIEVTSGEQLSELIAACTAHGWNVAIHALGDRANCRVLDALEQHWEDWSRLGLRPRIEHVQLLAPADVPRLGTMGIIASMQPSHCPSDMLMVERYWGARGSGAFVWRSLLESGAVLAFGSDAPVEDPDVMRGIFAAATRQREDGTPRGGWYPEQCLTVPEAVYAYTMGPAYACGEERLRGSLAVGKLADMVVLSQDIFHLPPRELLNTRVEATLLAGELVYCAG